MSYISTRGASTYDTLFLMPAFSGRKSGWDSAYFTNDFLSIGEMA
jgi:hypothetical protein